MKSTADIGVGLCWRMALLVIHYSSQLTSSHLVSAHLGSSYVQRVDLFVDFIVAVEKSVSLDVTDAIGITLTFRSSLTALQARASQRRALEASAARNWLAKASANDPEAEGAERETPPQRTTADLGNLSDVALQGALANATSSLNG